MHIVHVYSGTRAVSLGDKAHNDEGNDVRHEISLLCGFTHIKTPDEDARLSTFGGGDADSVLRTCFMSQGSLVWSPSRYGSFASR